MLNWQKSVHMPKKSQRSLSTGEYIKEFCGFNGMCILKKPFMKVSTQWPTRLNTQMSLNSKRDYYNGRNQQISSHKVLDAHTHNSNSDTHNSYVGLSLKNNYTQRQHSIANMRNNMQKRRLGNANKLPKTPELISRVNSMIVNDINVQSYRDDAPEIAHNQPFNSKFMGINNLRNVNKVQTAMHNCMRNKHAVRQNSAAL
jgi:hypothetical protein